VVFLVSATQQGFDYSRFREVLFSQRSVQRINALTHENALRRLQYAFDQKLVAPFGRSLKTLQNAMDKLRSKTHEAYSLALEDSARSVVCRLKQERVWQKLSGHIGGTMALAVYVRARIGHFVAAYASGRLLSRGHGLAAVIRMLWTSVGSLISQRYTLRALLAGQRDNLTRTLSDIATQGRRVLEESDIWLEHDSIGKNAVDSVHPDEGIDKRYRTGLKLLGIQIPESQPAIEEVDLSEVIDEAIEESAARQLTTFPKLYKYMTNLLPLSIAGVFIYRLGIAVHTEQYQGAAFFMNFFVIFALSHLPGYILASAWIARTASDTKSIISNIVEHVPIPGDIERVERQLAQFLQSVTSYRNKIDGWLTAITSELNPESFGVSATTIMEMGYNKGEPSL